MNINAIKHCSGMIYKSGYYTVSQFIGNTMFYPAETPAYFGLTSTGLVTIKPLFIEHCDIHYNNVKRNWSALGIARA